MKLSIIGNYASAAARFAYNNTPTVASPSQIFKNVTKIALPTIALVGAVIISKAEAGWLSGIGVGVGCVGMGVLFPQSLFWSAAPCYEAAMWATVNPLLP